MRDGSYLRANGRENLSGGQGSYTFGNLTCMTDDELTQAHSHSFRHKDEVRSSLYCGCFFCLEIFRPIEIVAWIDNGRTAQCPYCGIDSVIADLSGFMITEELLEEMHRRFF